MASYMKRMATTTLRIQIAPITILLAAIMLKVPFEVGLARRGGGRGTNFNQRVTVKKTNLNFESGIFSLSFIFVHKTSKQFLL